MIDKPTVLVVDDEERNQRLMEAVLTAAGYSVVLCGNGEQAMRRVADNAPDVVLLDIMMPVLDGIETCRRLKADPATAYIPVILVTSLSERSDRLRGIEAGANDFLTKPIDKEDVVLRVRNAAGAAGLHMELRRSYDRLKELEALRDNLTHMIVHDLRSPLAGISGYLELVQMDLEGAANPRAEAHVTKALASLNILMEMINSLLDINRMEEGKMPLNISQYALADLVRDALDSLGAAAQRCRIDLDISDGLPMVACDKDLIRRVFANLVGNALKFTPESGLVEVSATRRGNAVRVSVVDRGPGIPEEYQKKIFDKFGQIEMRAESNMYSTGLGLTFCKLAIEAHGGDIGVNSRPGEGSEFWFLLPLDR